MQIDKFELNNDSILTIEVTLDDKTIDTFIAKKSKTLYTDFEMKGYRKGKAPITEFEKKYPRDFILAQYTTELMNQTYLDIAKEKDFTPIDKASPEMISASPLKIRFTVPTLPKIKFLKPLDKIEIKFKETEITDTIVDETIIEIQKANPQLDETEENYTDLENQEAEYQILQDNNPIDPPKDQHVHIYDEKEQPIKDLREYLKGLKKGDKKIATLSIGHGDKSPCEIEITKVYKKTLIPINDEFPKKALKLAGDLKQYKEDIKNYMISQSKIKDDKLFEELLLESIIDNIDNFTPPTQIVNDQKNSLLQDVQKQLTQQGTTLDEYLKQIKKDLNTYNEELKETAIKRIKLQIALFQISHEHDIKVNQEDIDEKINLISSHYKDENQNKIREHLQKEEQQIRLSNEILNEKILAFLKEKVIIKSN